MVPYPIIIGEIDEVIEKTSGWAIISSA